MSSAANRRNALRQSSPSTIKQTNGRNMTGCGTCRIRKKACPGPGEGGSCSTCLHLRIECLQLYGQPVSCEYRRREVMDQIARWYRTRGSRPAEESLSLSGVLQWLQANRPTDHGHASSNPPISIPTLTFPTPPLPVSQTPGRRTTTRDQNSPISPNSSPSTSTTRVSRSPSGPAPTVDGSPQFDMSRAGRVTGLLDRKSFPNPNVDSSMQNSIGSGRRQRQDQSTPRVAENMPRVKSPAEVVYSSDLYRYQHQHLDSSWAEKHHPSMVESNFDSIAPIPSFLPASPVEWPLDPSIPANLALDGLTGDYVDAEMFLPLWNNVDYNSDLLTPNSASFPGFASHASDLPNASWGFDAHTGSGGYLPDSTPSPNFHKSSGTGLRQSHSAPPSFDTPMHTQSSFPPSSMGPVPSPEQLWISPVQRLQSMPLFGQAERPELASRKEAPRTLQLLTWDLPRRW